MQNVTSLKSRGEILRGRKLVSVGKQESYHPIQTKGTVLNKFKFSNRML